jgi:FkbM family methyltransferase
VVRVRDGFQLRVDGSSQSGRIVYVTGEYEPDTARLMRRRLQAGETMIDVGANIGYFTVAAALAVGPEGRVVAFEPAAATRHLLEENVRLNGLANVTVRDEALAATQSEAALYLGPQQDTGLASLRPLPGSSRAIVRQAPFDDLWPAAHRVALVKIDVEGAELAVLRGMAGLLERDHPDVIVEVTDRFLRELGASAPALFEFLTARGYRAFQIRAGASLHRIGSLGDLATCPPQFNALFSTKPDQS